MDNQASMISGCHLCSGQVTNIYLKIILKMVKSWDQPAKSKWELGWHQPILLTTDYLGTCV